MSEKKKEKTIRNRDIPLLQEVPCIMQDIEELEERRQWESERKYRITQHISSAPRGSGSAGGIDEVLSSIEKLEEEQRELMKQYIKKLAKASQLIREIPSTRMRTFVTMMYLNNTPGSVVRNKLKMSRRTFDKAKEAVEQAESMAGVQWDDRFEESV